MRQRPSPATLASATPVTAATEPPLLSCWLESSPASVEEQLAIDEAVLDEAERGLRTHRTVRTWMADELVVVVGSSSRLEQEVDRAACHAAGVRIVRRPTGGATVVLGPGCLMWSVITPYPYDMPSVDTLHATTLSPLCEAFATAGVPVTRQGTSDLTVGEQKVSGNALRVRKHAVLYHGTLLDDFDIDAAMQLLRHPPREPSYRGGRPHTSFLANLRQGQSQLEQLVRDAFQASTIAPPCDSSLVTQLLADRYESVAWNTRL